jgi:hypothetical protein
MVKGRLMARQVWGILRTRVIPPHLAPLTHLPPSICHIAGRLVDPHHLHRRGQVRPVRARDGPHHRPPVHPAGPGGPARRGAGRGGAEPEPRGLVRAPRRRAGWPHLCRHPRRGTRRRRILGRGGGGAAVSPLRPPINGERGGGWRVCVAPRSHVSGAGVLSSSTDSQREGRSGRKKRERERMEGERKQRRETGRVCVSVLSLVLGRGLGDGGCGGARRGGRLQRGLALRTLPRARESALV